MPVHHIYVLCVSLVTPEVRRGCQILLELELKIVDNCLVVAGNLTWVFWKSNQYSSPLSHLPVSLYHSSRKANYNSMVEF